MVRHANRLVCWGMILWMGLAALARAQQPPPTAATATPEQKLAAADALRAEGSFRLALEQYDQLLSQTELPEAVRQQAQVWRWDCMWRQRGNDDERQEAIKQLSRLMEDLPAQGDLRALAAESLGDLLAEFRPWDHRDQLLAAWLTAVKHWDKSTAPDQARPHYIALNFKIAEHLINRYGGPVPYPGDPAIRALGLLPPPPPEDKPWEGDTASWCLRNVLRVSEDPAQQTQALVMLARHRMNNYTDDKDYQNQTLEYFKKACAIEPANDWSDDALWEMGRFYENRGEYVLAAQTYDRLVKDFKGKRTPYFRQAQVAADNIRRPSLNFSAGDAFDPDSYIPLSINYRNMNRASVTVRRIEPEDYVKAYRDQNDRTPQLSLVGKTVREVELEGLIDEKKHMPRSLNPFLEPLPAGLYELAIGSPQLKEMDEEPRENRRTLVWIGRLGLAAKQDNAQVHAWVADIVTGQPVAGARLWLLSLENKRDATWLVQEAQSGDDGLAGFTVNFASSDSRQGRNWRSVLLAEKDGQLTRVESWGGIEPMLRENEADRTMVYAYTDRPAYRPGETIHWKAIARVTDGKSYQLPTPRSLKVVVRDGQNNAIYEGEHLINEWGTLTGELTPGDKAALGMLCLELIDKTQEGKERTLASAQLCRLEEYKLPEFKVQVVPGGEQVRFGQAAAFEVDAQYYFGGPVAGAEVEVIVHRRAFWPSWMPPRPYPWFYTDDDNFSMWRPWRPYEPEQVVMHETLKTGPDGKLRVEAGGLTEEEMNSAAERGLWGYQFRVEARVTDASRREVSASGQVRVARTAFAAYLNPKAFVYLPGDKVQVDLKTMDPNDRPVKTEGMVTIYKREYKEPEKKPGQPVPLTTGKTIVPVPTPLPGEENYVDTKLFGLPAATNEKGELTLIFNGPSEGYFVLKYASQDVFGQPVEAQTIVFVASANSTSIGYRSGGIEIITDKDTYRAGQTAHVMLCVRQPGAAVWLAAEGEAILWDRVVRPEGTVKLIDVEITSEMEPNFFLTAVAMGNRSAWQTQRRVVVPPEEQFLNVKLTTDKVDYRPGQQAQVTVEVTDDQGRPVATELSLAVADQAVWAIQSELAGDIRQVFWGRQRSLEISTQASAQYQPTQLWRPSQDKEGEYELMGRDEQVLREAKEEGTNLYFGMGGARRGVKMLSAKGGMAMDGDMVLQESMPAAAPMEVTYGLNMDSIALDGALESQAPAPRVRSDFRATALWLADVVTGEDGRATARVSWPDSLTTWQMMARTADKKTRVGQITHEVQTNKPLMVRPQGPRFLVENDRAVFSALVDNTSTATLEVKVALEVTGLTLEDGQAQRTVTLAPRSQERLDWTLSAPAPGQATVRMTALSPLDSDAVEKTYPVLEYGIEQFVASAARMDKPQGGEDLGKTLTLEIPQNRRPGSESLTVWVQPSLALAMVDALDYLADYPYGCVEQTLSRFVPAVITAQTLRQLGIPKPELEKKLPGMIKAGLKRLEDFQHGDGGWAWWREGDSDPFMTAYVVSGLAAAREAGVDVKGGLIKGGARFLRGQLVQAESQHDLSAFILYALAEAGAAGENQSSEVTASYEILWPERERLNPYTRSLLALACHKTGQAERAQVLARNLYNGLIQDKENGTAHWGEAGIHWRWSEGGVEATSFALRALLAIDPGNELIDPAATWLVRGRRGARWKNTRDTAIAIRALADYVAVRKEAQPNWIARVRVNGQDVGSLTVDAKTVFEFDGKIEVPASLLRTGGNEVTIQMQGSGTLYAAAWMTYFTREKEIPAVGNEVYVTRKYYLTTLKETLSGEHVTERSEIQPGQALVSGQRVQVELSIEAKNHYEYLVIEDPKPAGMEPAELQSGYRWDGGLGRYQEYRDEKSAIFISRLPEGKHTIQYELKVEVPGQFAALPAQIHAMYVPEIRGNSASGQVEVIDKTVQ